MLTKDMTVTALFTAVIAVFALIPPIPLPFSPVPITLQTLGIFLTAALLGSKKAFLATLLYVALGTIGLPIFSGYRGGFDVIVGPTGGYIIGFVCAAYVIGLLIEKSNQKNIYTYAFAMSIGLIILYALGTLQLAWVTKMPLSKAWLVGSLPYIPFDIAKGALATMVAIPVKRRIQI